MHRCSFSPAEVITAEKDEADWADFHLMSKGGFNQVRFSFPLWAQRSLQNYIIDDVTKSPRVRAALFQHFQTDSPALSPAVVPKPWDAAEMAVIAIAPGSRVEVTIPLMGSNGSPVCFVTENQPRIPQSAL